ncbi:flagellar hook-associated protein 1 [Salmonella enterica subsp. diarizonae]|uniref:Flagellar hook-associated protein 1 n=1 Tax=Salmonella diarizonae TaxID=59204 RepID=A0A379TYC9_SALDZ|nr:flagellar hook-associated protein 1 [Salmonella enterica subsp. diarizonae]
MSSLINHAMSGLNAAQAALSTVSNNINNYNVAGYTRQTTILAQANSTLGSGGWIGNGVYVSGVQREYDAFITNQLRGAQNQSSGLEHAAMHKCRKSTTCWPINPAHCLARCRAFLPVCKR